MGLHGGQLRGLCVLEKSPVQVSLKNFETGKDESEDNGHPEGLDEEFRVLLPEDIIGAYAEDEESGQNVGSAQNMHDGQHSEFLGNHCKEIGQLGPTVSDGVANRMLHPGIGNEDPDG